MYGVNWQCGYVSYFLYQISLIKTKVIQVTTVLNYCHSVKSYCAARCLLKASSQQMYH